MRLTYLDVKETVTKFKGGVVKRVILETPVDIRMPNTFEGMIKGIKRLARGWKVNQQGQISCADGYCIMGSLARQITPDVDKFPNDADDIIAALAPDDDADLDHKKVLRAKDLPDTDLVQRLIAANDGESDDCRDRITMVKLLGIKSKGKKCENCHAVHA